VIKVCIICGKEFETKIGKASLCSDECKRIRKNNLNQEDYAKNPQKYKDREAKSHKNNPGLKIARDKRTYDKRRESILKQKRDFHKDHKEEMSFYYGNRYIKNKEKISTRNKIYNQKTPGVCLICGDSTPTKSSEYCIKHRGDFLFEKYNHSIICESAIEYKFIDQFLSKYPEAKIKRSKRLFCIPYFDTEKNKWRKHYPDFIITNAIGYCDPEKIILVEIKTHYYKSKSSWAKEYFRVASLKLEPFYCFCDDNDLIPLWLSDDLFFTI